MGKAAQKSARVPSAEQQNKYCSEMAGYRDALVKAINLKDGPYRQNMEEGSEEYRAWEAQFAVSDHLCDDLLRIEKEIDEFFADEIEAMHPLKLQAIGRYWYNRQDTMDLW